MSLLSGLLGNASGIDLKQLNKDYGTFLISNEEIVAGFKLIRDQFVFTNKRIIFVNKQGLTGSKVEHLTIPYSKISMFSKENAGMLDLDCEIKLWVVGHSSPITMSFRKGENIDTVYKLLSQAIL
ncbi:MAG: hypothetical protein RLZZ156_634 [Deinococcota bacterium]|jgi:hypothetical protein